ncbi:2,3-diaminopropionate biosynthesis protein SbnA [Streptomyces sp. NBC_01351]|uniref:2,3-diaminopropionate biosynthesis protein SbnA n=1 Tax=Streptomyces sp. NBC_01351 TaxID=2903833 RepID=UPI002E2FAD17|nr:2,3-diaminopropionate biosynthesis protein SbnA [Streptomyces sp. NBC_01351]
MTAERVSDASGGNAFLELPHFLPSFDTFVKLEGLNPAGSIKMKAAREMVDAAEAQGLIGPDTRLIESTSGNLGIALASICAARGYPLTVVTDPNANARSLKYVRALGADLVVVTDRDAAGGYLRTRIDLIRRRVAADPRLLWLNQYTNPANVNAHVNHTGPEIFEGFGLPDWLFVGTGTSGTLMGCVRYLRNMGAPTTVVAVDALGSVTFGGPPGRRLLPGLGASRRPEIFHDDGSFLKAVIGEEDTIRACRRVAREYGLLLGGSSGTVLAAVDSFRDRIAPGSRVLAISPDMGDGYLDSIYDDRWVAERFGVGALEPARPVRSPRSPVSQGTLHV